MRPARSSNFGSFSCERGHGEADRLLGVGHQVGDLERSSVQNRPVLMPWKRRGAQLRDHRREVHAQEDERHADTVGDFARELDIEALQFALSSTNCCGGSVGSIDICSRRAATRSELAMAGLQVWAAAGRAPRQSSREMEIQRAYMTALPFLGLAPRASRHNACLMRSVTRPSEGAITVPRSFEFLPPGRR